MSTSTGEKKSPGDRQPFHFSRTIDKLEAANCVIERLDKPAASEEELIRRPIKGKHRIHSRQQRACYRQDY